MVSTTAATNYVQVAHFIMQREVLLAKFYRIAIGQFFSLVKLCVAQPGSICSQTTDPLNSWIIACNDISKVVQVCTIDHVVSRTIIHSRVHLFDGCFEPHPAG